MTDSFDEFMEVAREFVYGEFTIAPVTSEKVDGWESDANFVEYHFAPMHFAEDVILANLDCYSMD